MLVPASSGDSIQRASLPLTSAQVLALESSPVTVLAAPGAGFAYVPLGALFNYTAGATEYTDNGGTLGVYIGELGLIQIVTNGFWNETTSQVTYRGNAAVAIEAVSSWANEPVTVKQTTANPTLGNGTVTVTIWLSLVAIA